MENLETSEIKDISSDIKGTFQKAKGPEVDEGSHTFCPDCRRVLYSVWKYGPVTPLEHNNAYCICSGRMTGEVKKRVMVYDVSDVDPNYKEEKVDRSRAKESKPGRSTGVDK